MSPSVEPFNEAKYKALMDGLECSELSQSDLFKTENKRIDSEYYKKEYLLTDKICGKFAPLKDCVKKGYRVVYENTEIIDSDSKDCPYFVQASDLKTPFINKDNLYKVSKADWKKYPKGRINNGELLIEVKGKAEKVAIVQTDFPSYSLVSGSLFKLETNSRINEKVLLVYLISKFGLTYRNRYKSNLLISYISKPDLYNIPVPYFDDQFQQTIITLINQIYNIENRQNGIYQEAVKLLNNAFNLHISNNYYTINNFKSSFALSGRLDAEYYQPKYDLLFDTLSDFDCRILGGKNGLCDFKKSIEPGSNAYQESGIPFIRVSDIDKKAISQPDIYLSTDIVDNVEELFPKKDTILLSKDGSVGVAYQVREDMKAITSGALLHLTIKDKSKVLPEYLTLVLNSPIVQLQAERDTNGAIIQHWKPSEIEKVLIPILDMDVQEDIAQKVKESFALRKKSKELLEYAKQAVEMAIELGEDKAIEWLKDKVD